MAIKAVVFDIGDVLERVQPVSAWTDPWVARLGLASEALERAWDSIDPDDLIGIGKLTEVEFSARWATALGLSEEQAGAFMADMWDWYCGEPDTALIEYFTALRPRYLTGILSNSADGARREEERRYGFPALVDVLIYSHEVGMTKPDPQIYTLTCAQLGVEPGEVVFLDDMPINVDAANRLGMHGVLHVGTAESIKAIDALLEARPNRHMVP